MALPIPARCERHTNRRVSMRWPDRDRLQHARTQKMDEKMIAMADVIERAINEILWTGEYLAPENAEAQFSCVAIQKSTNWDNNAIHEICSFLQSMGISCSATQQFSEIAWGEKRQYARAFWLTWAAMIAREEGKTL